MTGVAGSQPYLYQVFGGHSCPWYSYSNRDDGRAPSSPRGPPHQVRLVQRREHPTHRPRQHAAPSMAPSHGARRRTGRRPRRERPHARAHHLRGVQPPRTSCACCAAESSVADDRPAARVVLLPRAVRCFVFLRRSTSTSAAASSSFSGPCSLPRRTAFVKRSRQSKWRLLPGDARQRCRLRRRLIRCWRPL